VKAMFDVSIHTVGTIRDAVRMVPELLGRREPNPDLLVEARLDRAGEGVAAG
jgi:hypothetical protein